MDLPWSVRRPTIVIPALLLLAAGCGGGGGGTGSNLVTTTLSGSGAPPVTTQPPSPPNNPQPPSPNPPITLPPSPIIVPPLDLGGPTGPFTQNLGICIDYSVKPESEWDLLAAGGYKVVRFDFVWASVEKSPGVYNFAGDQNYDAMVDALSRRGIRIVFILDYGNPLYDGGNAPYTDDGRAAFARFAAAAATHFKGKNIVWEIWNEPNEPGFWKMASGVTTPISHLYADLMQTVIPAMRNADSNAFIVGPSVSNLKDGDENYGALTFIRELGRRDLLKQLDAISVHSYRPSEPETAASDYTYLRAILAQYSASDKPIYDTEIGRSTGNYVSMDKISSDEQGGWLVRTFLTDMASNVGMTIWYTWHDAGNNSSIVGDNFGVITKNGQPKQVYQASKTLAATLDGYRFLERVSGSYGPDVYVYKFSKGAQLAYVVWKSTPNGIIADIPIPSGSWNRLDTFGAPTAVTSTGTLSTAISTMPQYFVPAQ